MSLSFAAGGGTMREQHAIPTGVAAFCESPHGLSVSTMTVNPPAIGWVGNVGVRVWLKRMIGALQADVHDSVRWQWGMFRESEVLKEAGAERHGTTVDTPQPEQTE